MTDPLDIALIGHCAKNEITIKGATTHPQGGGVSFSALSAAWCLKSLVSTPVHFRVFTIRNPADFDQIRCELVSANPLLSFI
jgi:hypothetical protein